MWRDKDAMLQMADEAAAENHPNKQRFAAYFAVNCRPLAQRNADQLRGMVVVVVIDCGRRLDDFRGI